MEMFARKQISRKKPYYMHVMMRAVKETAYMYNIGVTRINHMSQTICFIPLLGKNKSFIPKIFHVVASLCIYHRMFVQFTNFQRHQIHVCRWVLNFCQFDKISLRTWVFAYMLLRPCLRAGRFRL